MITAKVYAILVSLLTTATALQKLEPVDGQFIFGPWLDTSSGPVSGGDSSSAFNKRLGYNAGVFQLYQSLPLTPPVNGPPDYDIPNHNPDGSIDISILDEGTTAAIFLTIYPKGVNNILDDDIIALANQCQSIISSTGRSIFIRFGPEMNGDWMSYGKQPQGFVSLWKRVYTTINQIAPSVAMVWSPNPDTPDSQYPYAPYWPGAEYVDWVGLSIYWKGYNYNYPMSFMTNGLCPSDYTAQMMDAKGDQGGKISFYQTYAVGYDKPIAISEGGGAFQLDYSENGSVTQIDPGPGRAAVVMSFWNSNIFNPKFMKNYPKFKMALAFEIWKEEPEGGQYITHRDYRFSVDSTTLTAFQTSLQAFSASVNWAPLAPTNPPKPSTAFSAAAGTAAPQTGAAVVVTQPATPGNKDQNSNPQTASARSDARTLSLLFTVFEVLASFLFIL